MDWARRIVVSGRELVAEVETADGRVDLLALKELGRHGVPDGKPAARRRLDLKFKDCVPIDSRVYRDHFGLGKHTVAADCHQVFEVLVGGDRYLVPALAMMRALFRPSLHLLPQMFLPNVLARACRLGWSGELAHVVVDAPWATGYDAEQRADCEGPLQWMMLHPTARWMADSVHQHAMAGRVAVDLPEGEAEIVFAGLPSETAFFVTEVRILSVTPLESPDFPVDEPAGRIDFVNRTWAEGRNLRESVSTDVPLHADGSHAVTDAEWAVVGPLLESARKTKSAYQHCQRAMFDGVLGKLATGKSWRDSPYAVGDWRNAATSYRRWNSRGTFDQALQALRGMR